MPAWTDRVLYATYSDTPDVTDGSGITNLLYTSIPSYTTSDHVRHNPQFPFRKKNDMSLETYSGTSTPPVFNPCSPVV